MDVAQLDAASAPVRSPVLITLLVSAAGEVEKSKVGSAGGTGRTQQGEMSLWCYVILVGTGCQPDLVRITLRFLLTLRQNFRNLIGSQTLLCHAAGLYVTDGLGFVDSYEDDFYGDVRLADRSPQGEGRKKWWFLFLGEVVRWEVSSRRPNSARFFTHSYLSSHVAIAWRAAGKKDVKTKTKGEPVESGDYITDYKNKLNTPTLPVIINCTRNSTQSIIEKGCNKKLNI